MTEEELKGLAERARAAYDAMTPSQKLRHDYEQRRSFARGMCPNDCDYTDYKRRLDEIMPPSENLTDAEIGLFLIGHG